MKQEYVLVSVVGKTDPIRGLHDGPILHIVRNYQPTDVILILTEEISRDENQYHHNQEAIQLLSPDCRVETIETGIRNPHSYDDFSYSFLEICNKVKEQYPEKIILLNITSGTPQMETAMCMIAISDPGRYLAVQVSSPEKSANKNSFFQPEKDAIKEWFEMDLDNEEGISSRCHTPELLNFKRPIIQFQILSLIKNYDYAGAFQIYEENAGIFSKKVGQLLEHAKYRLNIQYEEAKKLADQLEMKKELYFVARLDIERLVDFFNGMKIKQFRGELNDFAMRLEILTEYLALYILEKPMKIKRETITEKRGNILHLSKEACTSVIPGIEKYLDQQFFAKKKKPFMWGQPLNALSTVYIVKYLSQRPEYQKYVSCTDEMLRWAELANEVRNPAAHTIVSITEDKIRRFYGNKNSAELCKAMQAVLLRVFGNEAKKEAFEIYEIINKEIQAAMT